MTNKIKQFRKEKNISQQALALKCDVRRETISRLERNKYTPSLILAMKIAKVFSTSIEDVFSLES